MKFVLSIVLTATLMLCALSLIFAAYPNQTSPYSGGFEVTPLNIFLYCLLPFIFGLIILFALFFLIKKNRYYLIYTEINLAVFEVLMIAYTIFLYCISSSGWIGIYFNVASDLIIAILMLAIFIKLKKVKQTVVIK